MNRLKSIFVCKFIHTLCVLTLVLVLNPITVWGAFNAADLTNAALGYIQTDNCLTECFDYFSTSAARYCNNAGVYYCCSTTISNTKCYNNLALGSVCSDYFTSSSTNTLKYSLCPSKNPTNCGVETSGNTKLTPTIQFQEIKSTKIY